MVAWRHQCSVVMVPLPTSPPCGKYHEPQRGRQGCKGARHTLAVRRPHAYVCPRTQKGLTVLATVKKLAPTAANPQRHLEHTRRQNHAHARPRGHTQAHCRHTHTCNCACPRVLLLSSSDRAIHIEEPVPGLNLRLNVLDREENPAKIILEIIQAVLTVFNIGDDDIPP